MRKRKDGCDDKSDGKDSARVQRLEQQIADMAAELAKLGEPKSSPASEGSMCCLD
jgi:hypothetical protein